MSPASPVTRSMPPACGRGMAWARPAGPVNPGAGARARALPAALREDQRGGVEGVDRLARERGGGRRVGLSLLQLLARRRHLALREAEGALELRRDERVPAGGLADVTLHHRRPLLDRSLARPRGGPALPALQRP